MKRARFPGVLTILLSVVALLSGCDDDREEPSLIEIPLPSITPPLPGPELHGVDRRLPDFEPSAGPELGSVELLADGASRFLAESWAQALNATGANITVTVGASEAAVRWWEVPFPSAIALLGEPMQRREADSFAARWGHSPMRLRVAMDPLVVIVHPDNPMVGQGLTLADIKRVFGAVQERTPAGRWGDFGAAGDWKERSIHSYGPARGLPLATSARRDLLAGREFRPGIERLPTIEAVVAAVANDPHGIGIATLAATGDRVDVVPISGGRRGPFALPTPESLLAGHYPLPPRFCYLYLERQPGIVLDALRRELVRFIYSRDGQRIAAETGRLPLPAPIAARELDRHGITLSPEDVLLARYRPASASSSRPATVDTTAGASHSNAPR